MAKAFSGTCALRNSASVVALALFAGLSAPANAQVVNGITIEGGAACPFGENGSVSTSIQYYYAPKLVASTSAIGQNSCGWTGRAGFTHEGRGQFLFGLDYWGMFIRHSDLGSRRFHSSASQSGTYVFTPFTVSNTIDGRVRDNRTVVDFEVGQDLGIGGPVSKLRLTGGLRYAHYRGKVDGSGAYAYVSNYVSSKARFDFEAKTKFDGIGPRIGFDARLPLTPGVSFVMDGWGSILWGSSTSETSLTGKNFIVTSSAQGGSSFVKNLEGSAGLAFSLGKAELVAGARIEAWFDEPTVKKLSVGYNNSGGINTLSGTFGGTADHHNFEPFVRLNIPLN